MATLKQVQDGANALIRHGVNPNEEIRFEHDIAYAGDTDDPSLELTEAMAKAGWEYQGDESCFTLGYG